MLATAIAARRRALPRGDQRGAVVVEAAFVFPVIFLVVIAVIEYGLLFAGQSTSESSTRSGSRYGSANFAVAGSKSAAADEIATTVAKDLGALTSLDVPVKLYVYKADGNGDPAGGYTGASACNADCYRYAWDTTANTWTRVTASPGWTNPQACIIDANNNAITPDTLGVYVEVTHSYVTKMLGSVQTLKEHTVSRLEPLPLSQCI